MVDEDKELTPEAEQDSAKADSADFGAAKAPKQRNTGAWLGYGALALVLILVAAGVFLLHELRFLPRLLLHALQCKIPCKFRIFD